MSSYKSYPKVYNLGHSAIKDLFHDEVVIQEKLDGSQFSFGIVDGEFRRRSSAGFAEYYKRKLAEQQFDGI